MNKDRNDGWDKDSFQPMDSNELDRVLSNKLSVRFDPCFS